LAQLASARPAQAPYEEPSPEKIFQVGLGFWGSKALLSAVELGVFTVLAQGSLEGEQLRQRLGLHPRGARDFFDTLVSLGFLDRNGTHYSNSADADFFLDREKPSYIGGILEMANARLYGFWGSLTEALQTGKPQNEGKVGGNIFAAIYANPERLRSFASAMTGISAGAARAIAEKFPWQDYKTFADIGTAQGGLPVQVASAHPHVTGIGYDVPVVQPVFEECVRRFSLENRLRFVPGDFFKDPLPKADVIVMGHILHDWGLDQKRELIGKAYDTLPTGGAYVVFDALIDDARRYNTLGLLMSLNMLIETESGFDYTGQDCTGWMRDAGFSRTYVEHLAGPDSMVVGIK
jgi:precorrin-6B methylase 2